MSGLTAGMTGAQALDRFERILAYAALLLIALVAVALARGVADGGHMPAVVWLHLASVALPLCLTPVMLLRRRGDSLHRTLGWIWATSMFATALVSFGIRDSATLSFSVIHIFSVVTVVTTPLLVLAARRGKLARHRQAALLTCDAHFEGLPDVALFSKKA